MIEIIARDGPPEALLCPAFICDACRTQVVKDGNVLYSVRYVNGARESSPLFVSHKKCTPRLDAWIEASYPSDEGWLPGWEEAQDFIRQLANNLKHAFAEDTEGTYLPQMIVTPAGTA